MIAPRIHKVIFIGCICFVVAFAGNPDSSKTKTIIGFINTLNHGIILKNQRYSEEYRKLDETNKRRISERYNDFLFDSLYPTFSLSIDLLCMKFDSILGTALLNYVQETNPFSDEFFDIELARLYLCRPDDFERSIKTFDLQSQKQLVDYLPNGWNRLKQESQQKMDRIDSLSIKLKEFYKGIMK